MLPCTERSALLMALVAYSILLGFALGCLVSRLVWEAKAINHHAAYYTPDTGSFAWKE